MENSNNQQNFNPEENIRTAKKTAGRQYKHIQNPEDLAARAAVWRRTLHQYPEIGLETWNTAAYCKKQLENTGFEIIDLHDPESASFAAYLDLGKDSAVAFRTDMDALPVEEKTKLEFQSQKPGLMHACGHDGHMSLVMGFAHEAGRMKDQLEHNILLLFQAGEESPGGAARITASGIFEEKNVIQVFGTHLWPMIGEGQIATRALEMMSQSCEVHIRIHGKSAHAARYQEGNDALEAGASLLLDLYALEKSLPDDQYRLLRFGRMEAGTVCNAVAAECVLEGTLRSFLDPVIQHLKQGILDLAAKQEQKTGCTIEVEFADGYPAVINDPALCQALFERFPQIMELEKPEMISEDFSEYQRRVPGVFFFLGTGTGIPLHADTFNFNEAIVLNMIDLYLDLALHPIHTDSKNTA